MNEKEYLRKLRWYIGLNLPQKAVKQIMEQYAAYFEEGRRAGKSEASLVQECGIPQLVAAELISAEQRDSPSLIGWRLLGIAALWVCIGWLYRTCLADSLPAGLVLLLLGLAAAFFLLGGIRMPTEKEPIHQIIGFYAFNLAVLVGLGAVIRLGFTEKVLDSGGTEVFPAHGVFELLGITTMEQVGPWMNGLLWGQAGLALLFLLIAAWKMMRKSSLYLPLFGANAGILMAAVLHQSVLRMVTNTTSYGKLLVWVYVCVGVGLVIGLLLLIVALSARRFSWKRS